MAEEGGESAQQEYKLVTEAGQGTRQITNLFFYSETVNKSFGYTGKGVATYPNGDTYDGFFVNGVS